MTYFYFGIHKAASTWLIQILYDLSDLLNINHKHYHSAKMFNHNIENEIAINNLDFFSYTNAEYNSVKKLNRSFKGFHVIRDPRDIVVSSYFSHLKTHSDYMWPELNEYRAELKSLNFEEGIQATMRHLDDMMIDGEPVKIFDSLNNWNYDNENIFETRFEDLTKNPYIFLPKIFIFLGLLDKRSTLPHTLTKKEILNELIFNINSNKKRDLNFGLLMSLIYKHDFYFKTKGRFKGELNENSHYRKGEVGDWQNYFTKKNINYFKDNYGELLIKLGYENNNNW
ncbi:sulfotransferase domain-containing protein [uncultured Lutibacter sp.]|uniref:sulfotransferase domain-containing protein n=1 Tax=uncultured Lutibacter sp. TaxID=437739 RepID=UPI0026204E23|nr:sulfotransferase domain-containing protein [uncultured Lutibacter sp.]